MNSWVGYFTFFFFVYGWLFYFGILYVAYLCNFFLFLALFCFAFWDIVLNQTEKNPCLPLSERSSFFKAILHGVIDYFHTGLHVDEEIVEDLRKLSESGKKFIFTSHPHGTLGTGSNVLLCGSKQFKELGLGKIRLLKLAASALMKIPVARHLALSVGLISADRNVAKKTLDSKDFSLVIVLGGEREQLLGQADPDVIYCKHRKGFIKLALEHGNCVIVPSYTFGETESYVTSGWLMKFRLWVSKKFRVALIIQWGRLFLPLVPKEVEMNVVVGKPIIVVPGEASKDKEETERIVQKYLDQYCEGLNDVFEKYKDRFGYADRKLKFV